MSPLLTPKILTIKHANRVRVIQSEIQVSQAHRPGIDPTPTHQTFNAIWDTGATGSAITQKVVLGLGLKPTGMTVVHGVHGPERVNQYLVNIIFPSNVGVAFVEVTEVQLLDGTDALIGMDIIGSGDLAITNKDNKTVFSFRIPSIEHIDFNEERHIPIPSNLPASERNKPCPCGSGKRYKNCHGANV